MAVTLTGSVLLSGCQSLSLAWAMAQYERTLDTYAQTDTTLTEVTNHPLCLDTTDSATSVFFPAGNLVDPREDLNPDTNISVSHKTNRRGANP